MRNILTVALTAGFVALGAAAANAGETSVYNRYEWNKTYNGYTETNIDAHIDSESITKTISESTKVEAIADKGDINTATVKYKNGEFEAYAHSENGRPVDPVATVYTSTVTQFEFTKTNESVDVDTFSSNEFSGDSFTHSVGNKF